MEEQIPPVLFSAKGYRFGMASADRNLDHLYPEFSQKVRAILGELNAWCVKHFPGHVAALAEGFRTTARQQELYAQGRTTPGKIVTYKNGTTNPSNHQTGLAADIVASGPHGLTWECPDAFWPYLQHLAHVHGLTSGSDWQGFKDLDHVEWITSDAKTYAAAHEWKKAHGLS